MNTATDEIVNVVSDGLEVGDVVLLADVLAFLKSGNISYSDADIQEAITRLRTRGVKVESLGSPARIRFTKST